MKSLNNAALWIIQRILDEIAMQVDDFERRYGPTDRSDFDGDFYVPTEVRNRINSAKGSLRIHGGLLTLSRSRTFLTLSSNSKSSIHSSTPDLSRSVPNTPGSNHKISLTSSYDSVLEENETEGVMVIKKGKGKVKKSKGKSHHSSLHHIFSNNVQMRRKSEDLLDSRAPSSSNGSTYAASKPAQHIRQGSDQAYRLIPRVKTSGLNDNSAELTRGQSTDAYIEHVNNQTRWGNVRGSNSFAGDLSISSLSTYTIPRVNLSQNKVEVTEAPSNGSTQNLPRKSLPESRVSTFLMRHNTDDSVA